MYFRFPILNSRSGTYIFGFSKFSVQMRFWPILWPDHMIHSNKSTTFFEIAELKINFMHTWLYMRYVYVLRWSEKLEDLKKVLKQLWEQYFGKKSILKAFFEKMSLFMISARPTTPVEYGFGWPASGLPRRNQKQLF